LKRWVQSGRTLVAIGGAAQFCATEESGLTDVRIVGSKKKEKKADDGAEKDASAEGEEDADETAQADEKPLFVPGAIIDADMDRTHFLAFGNDSDRLPVLVMTDAFFNRSKKGTNVLAFPEEDRRLAGYVWPDNSQKLLGGTAALIDVPLGDGHVVLFGFEPGFRGFWPSSARLLANAVLYAPTMSDVPVGY
jgi:hypothetical protein